MNDDKLKYRNETIELLEAYSKFLENHGYMDIDWRTEPPFAIDEFLVEYESEELKGQWTPKI